MIENPYQDSQGLYSEAEGQRIERQQKLNSFFSKLKYYLIQIWPFFYKILNGIVYWTLKIIKSSVSYAFQQIKFGG